MAWQPRDRDAFVHTFLARLPLGEIWPRDPDAWLVKFATGLMGIVARWAARVGVFLRVESFPPTSLELLPDWERVLGLPEPCLPAPESIPERQAKVAEKLARRPGRQDRGYFYELARSLGYDITITEYVPAQCGLTQCGATLVTDGPYRIQGAGCGSPAIRFVWSITVTGPRLTWFSVGGGGGRAGQDPHLRIARADDLECILRKLKPAHTNLVFNYTGA